MKNKSSYIVFMILISNGILKPCLQREYQLGYSCPAFLGISAEIQSPKIQSLEIEFPPNKQLEEYRRDCASRNKRYNDEAWQKIAKRHRIISHILKDKAILQKERACLQTELKSIDDALFQANENDRRSVVLALQDHPELDPDGAENPAFTIKEFLSDKAYFWNQDLIVDDEYLKKHDMCVGSSLPGELTPSGKFKLLSSNMDKILSFNRSENGSYTTAVETITDQPCGLASFLSFLASKRIAGLPCARFPTEYSLSYKPALKAIIQGLRAVSDCNEWVIVKSSEPENGDMKAEEAENFFLVSTKNKQKYGIPLSAGSYYSGFYLNVGRGRIDIAIAPTRGNIKTFYFDYQQNKVIPTASSSVLGPVDI